MIHFISLFIFLSNSVVGSWRAWTIDHFWEQAIVIAMYVVVIFFHFFM